MESDERQHALDAALRKHQYRQDALIEILHTAQNAYGYLPRDVLWYVARQLRLPPSKVYGVATFYHFFTLEPSAPHTAVVCQGTACYLHGASGIVAALRRRFTDGEPGGSPEGRVSLTFARCLGMSALAPVVVVDGRVIARTAPAEVLPRVEGVIAATHREGVSR